MSRPRFLPDNFTLALIATVLLATFLPCSGQTAVVFEWVTNIGIGLLFFLHGAKLSRQAIIAGMTHWRLHLLVFACTFVMFPLLGLALKPALSPMVTPELYLGILFLCALPATVQSSIAFTSLARGNVPAAVCSASVSSLLGVFLTPLLVKLMRAIDQQLLRHAADVDAGATQVATLRHRDTGTEAGGEAGGAYAPGAGADDEQIEIERHVPTPGSDAFQHNPFASVGSRRIDAETCRNGSAQGLAGDGLCLSVEVSAMSPTLTHLALHVPDLDACIAFYETFCGMRVIHRRPGKGSQIVWMAEPGQEQRFIFVIMPGGQPRNLASDDYSHFGFALSSRAAVDDLARRAEAAGCLVWAPRDEPYPVGYYCGLRDPAGNYVEFSYGQPLGPGSEALPIP